MRARDKIRLAELKQKLEMALLHLAEANEELELSGARSSVEVRQARYRANVAQMAYDKFAATVTRDDLVEVRWQEELDVRRQNYAESNVTLRDAEQAFMKLNLMQPDSGQIKMLTNDLRIERIRNNTLKRSLEAHLAKKGLLLSSAVATGFNSNAELPRTNTYAVMAQPNGEPELSMDEKRDRALLAMGADLNATRSKGINTDVSFLFSAPSLDDFELADGDVNELDINFAEQSEPEEIQLEAEEDENVTVPEEMESESRS